MDQQITEEESKRRLERLKKLDHVAGPDDPIYKTGLRKTSVPALTPSTKTSPNATAGTKAEPKA
jgi:hypothetical protein